MPKETQLVFTDRYRFDSWLEILSFLVKILHIAPNSLQSPLPEQDLAEIGLDNNVVFFDKIYESLVQELLSLLTIQADQDFSFIKDNPNLSHLLIKQFTLLIRSYLKIFKKLPASIIRLYKKPIGCSESEFFSGNWINCSVSLGFRQDNLLVVAILRKQGDIQDPEFDPELNRESPHSAGNIDYIMMDLGALSRMLSEMQAKGQPVDNDPEELKEFLSATVSMTILGPAIARAAAEAKLKDEAFVSLATVEMHQASITDRDWRLDLLQQALIQVLLNIKQHFNCSLPTGINMIIFL